MKKKTDDRRETLHPRQHSDGNVCNTKGSFSCQALKRSVSSKSRSKGLLRHNVFVFVTMKPQEFETDSYQSLQPKLGLIGIKFLTADVFDVFILQCESDRPVAKISEK